MTTVSFLKATNWQSVRFSGNYSYYFFKKKSSPVTNLAHQKAKNAKN